VLQCNGCNGSVCVRKLKKSEPLLTVINEPALELSKTPPLKIYQLGRTTVDEREKELPFTIMPYLSNKSNRIGLDAKTQVMVK
jgi:hypothetical protein